jgi:SnoaL-like domain
MLFNVSAHSPLLDSQREANHSSLRRPSSRASAPSASAVSTLAHSSRSLPPNYGKKVRVVAADLIARARAGDGERQVAVLILRDVLGFHTSEVAAMLDSTVESVTSALKRARAGLQRRRQPAGDQEPPPASGSPAEEAIVAKFTSAWESADLAALVALPTDDAFISMPPMPFEYEGRDVVARFCASLFGAGRRFDLVPTRANGQPAFGAYLRTAAGIRHGTGLYVLTLAGDRICAMTRFDNSVLPWFGLPRSLPSR